MLGECFAKLLVFRIQRILGATKRDELRLLLPEHRLHLLLHRRQRALQIPITFFRPLPLHDLELLRVRSLEILVSLLPKLELGL